MTIKIAAASEDGLKLSSHFGMAPTYIVYTLSEGQIVSREERAKPHNTQHGDHQHHDHHHVEGRGHGHGRRMFDPIKDCQVLLCGGMGGPAYQKALDAGLEVIMTGGAIEAAVQAYLAGSLATDLRRVHSH